MNQLPVWAAEYFQRMDLMPWRFCKEQHALRKQVEKAYLTEDLTVYEERYAAYVKMGGFLGYGDGYDWERFLIGCFLCTYNPKGLPRWRRTIVYLGRGAGKDGCISWMSLCLISPYNPVLRYDVDIGAFNETQALRPVEDVRDALKSNETKMRKFFKWTLEVIQSKKTGAKLRGWANNSKGLDGLRSGAVFLDEVHQYEDNKTIEVFTSGLGKVDDGRLGIFTTEGYVQDGPLDEYLKKARACLFDGEPDDGWLYFICKLDKEDEVHDEENWHKANPSLWKKPSLMEELRSAYQDWKKAPGQNKDFLCKRMNLKQVQNSQPVAEWADIEATNVELPMESLEGQECGIGIDFAKTTDWAAVNVHFRDGDVRYDINHAWICLQSDELWRLKCPYRQWAEDGHITLVDGPEIPPEMLAKYVADMTEIYDVRYVAIDSYRYSLMSHELEKVGFSAADKNLYLTRPSDVIRVAPQILRCFRNRYFIWGDVPHLRWATNNACLVPAKKSKLTESGELDMGNYLFGKQEHHARKTDPFMALVASMTHEDELAPLTSQGWDDFDVIAF